MHMHRNTKKLSYVRCLTGSLTITVLILLSATKPGMAQTEAEQDPTDVLRKEHKIIHKMADAAKQDAKEIQNSDEVDAERIAKYHDFFKNFADRCHHAKEEEELFPVLREMKVDPVIIDLLTQQHEQGRLLLGGIKEVLTALKDNKTVADTQALARYILEYAELMDRHIRIENEYLWPRVAEQLSDLQKEALAEAFYRIETDDLGKGFHEKYHALAMDVLGKKGSP